MHTSLLIMGGNTSKSEEKIEAEDVNDQDGGDHFGPEFLPIHMPSVGSTFASILFSMALVALIFLAVRKCLHRYGGRRAGGRRRWDEVEYGYHAYPFAGVELDQRHRIAPALDYYAARPLPPRPMPALYAPGADMHGRIYEVVGGDAPEPQAPENVTRRAEEPAYVAPAKAGKLRSPLVLSDSTAQKK